MDGDHAELPLDSVAQISLYLAEKLLQLKTIRLQALEFLTFANSCHNPCAYLCSQSLYGFFNHFYILISRGIFVYLFPVIIVHSLT